MSEPVGAGRTVERLLDVAEFSAGSGDNEVRSLLRAAVTDASRASRVFGRSGVYLVRFAREPRREVRGCRIAVEKIPAYPVILDAMASTTWGYISAFSRDITGAALEAKPAASSTADETTLASSSTRSTMRLPSAISPE